MYSEKVMDHFSNPRNVGQIDNANAVGEVGNAKCGDIMKIYMDIQDDVIKDVTTKFVPVQPRSFAFSFLIPINFVMLPPPIL